MLHDELLGLAKELADSPDGSKSKARWRRAVSTSYYALFHLLVDDSMRLLLHDSDLAAMRPLLARTFTHKGIKDVCAGVANDRPSGLLSQGFGETRPPAALISVAKSFVDLQTARHLADYDLDAPFSREFALQLVSQAETAFAEWRTVRTSKQAKLLLVALFTQSRIAR